VIGGIAAALAVLLAGLGGYLAFGPRERLNLVPRFDGAALPADLDRYLATEEAKVGGITPGAEKRIVWAGAAGAETDFAVVYLHGFSATSEEIRPVPDDVARRLGANLFFTRFAGHGVGGARLAGPTAQDWLDDTAEALAVGRRLGRKVIVIATSTGGTLAAEAALHPAMVRGLAGIVFISPNFGLGAPGARLLTLPGVRVWGPWLAGAEQCFTPRSAEQAKFWTTCYPTAALVPMAALAAHAARADYRRVTVPALFLFTEADQVVAPAATRAVAAGWGAPADVRRLQVGPGDDPYSHVIAGRILSPGMTAPVEDAILAWVSAR